jgi:serine O-acetyltransferase
MSPRTSRNPDFPTDDHESSLAESPIRIAGRAELRAYLRADMWFTCQRERWDLRFFIFRRALYYQRVLRHAEYWESTSGPLARVLLSVYKLRLAFLGERIGLSISRGTCGPGLSISHPGLLVVNGQARLGARCRVSQGVTIGASQYGAPVIGDDVFVGPNAQVIGPVRVGHGSTILPGAVVVSDVPPKSTVGGVPAQILRSGTPPWHRRIAPTRPFAGKYSAPTDDPSL